MRGSTDPLSHLLPTRAVQHFVLLHSYTVRYGDVWTLYMPVRLPVCTSADKGALQFLSPVLL